MSPLKLHSLHSPTPHLLHLSCRRSIPWHHYRMPYVAWWSIAGELHRLRLVRWSHGTAKMPKVVVQRYPSHATGRRRLPQFLSPLNGFCRCSRRKKWGTHWVSLQIPTKTVVFLLFLQILYAVYIYIYIYIYTRSVNKHGYIWPNKWWQYTGTICGGLHPFKLHSSEDTTSNIFHFVLFLPSGISTIPRTTIWTSIVFQGVGNPRKPPQWLQLNRHLKWWLGPSWGLVGFNVLFFKKKKGFEDS